MTFLIYGANGYTGELIAREAVKRGMKPILAGRSQKKVEPLAKELGLVCRTFSLEDKTSLDYTLERGRFCYPLRRAIFFDFGTNDQGLSSDGNSLSGYHRRDRRF